MVLKTRVLLPVIALLLSFECFGQISFDSQEELEKAANEFFEAEDYAKAKPLFSQLLSKDALDPNFNYRFGVCIMFTEADPLKPLPYIEGGANSKGVNPEAFYYLGKAYQLNYRFDDAIKAYQTGKSVGFSSQKIDLDRSMQECRNGKILYNAAIDFQPAMDKEVIATEFYRPYDFRKLKGKVIPMPPNFKTKYDQKNLLGTVIYTPTNSEVLVYASYGEDGANAKDLYRVNRLPNGEWALPQRLSDVINTKFDEDYAFFDEETQTLFFASKGHNTMGGYDVFSSKYDAAANSWSTPLNLQFPINSPFDDFLYVSDPEGKVAFFTTGRNTEAGKLRVLKTLLHDPNQVEVSVVEGTFEDLTDSVYNYAALTVIDPASNEVIGKYRTNKISGKYLLILPPQNDYTMDVGPKEAHGFKFDLDVPKTEPHEALQQLVTYNASGENATVSVTNYFNAAGEADTVSVAEKRSLTEVTEQMAAMPQLSEEELAQLRPNKNATNDQQQQLAAAREQAKQDSIKQAEQLAAQKLQQEAESLAMAAKEQARLDSIQQASQLAAAREKAVRDSIASAQRMALEKQQLLAAQEEAARREQAQADSLKRVQEELLAAELRAQEEAILAEEIAAKEELLKQKMREDSIKYAQALELKAQEEAALAAAMEAERQKASDDSLKQVAAAQERIEQQARRDSLANAEKIAAELAQRQKAVADSLAEAERLAAIEREVEMAKQQALRDSMLVMEAETEMAQTEVDGAGQTYADILKEMAAKEAEILGKGGGKQEPQALDAAAKGKPAESNPEVPLQSAEIVEESDLYLKTIADLEKQQQEQAELVAEENRQRERAKAEKQAAAELEKRQRQAESTSADAGVIVSDSTGAMTAAVSAEPSQKSSTSNATNEQPLDGELESVALKSDADPNEYLKALAEIEAQVQKDAASRPDKDYSLRSMAELQPVATTDADPVLQAKIEADRRALAEHQLQAKVKEEALKAQMDRDRAVLNTYDGALSDELATAELEMMQTDTSAAKPRKLADILAHKQERIEAAERVKEEIAPAQQELVLEADELMISEEAAAEVNETEVVQVEVSKETAPVDEALLKELAAMDEPMVPEKATELESEPSEELPKELAGQPVAVPPEKVEEVVEVPDALFDQLAEMDAVVADQEKAVKAETPTEVAPVIEEKVQPAVEEALQVAVAAEEVSTEEPAEMEEEQPMKVETASAPKEAAVGTVGTIPFLTAAKRDYSMGKPSFDKIQDAEMRRMVKRMRAEDVGRLAVLKNMKNEWVQAGKTQDALAEIKDNRRNKDVLANLPDRGREEYIRPPFDKNDLRARQDVYYKLKFVMEPAGVSETVSAAMSPESAITFAMPSVSISSGYYLTVADATAEMKEYQHRGLKNVKIVPFHNGNEVTLSDVQDVPFVD